MSTQQVQQKATKNGSQVAAASTADELNFHPLYGETKPGSVMLQADDDQKQVFCFNLALLSALSSFFADLPPPTRVDYIASVPLIRLPGTTSVGLYYFLQAIGSLTSSTKLNFTSVEVEDMVKCQGIMNAAVIGKIYLVPVIPRLLCEGMQDWSQSPSDMKRILVFSIWAMSEDESMTIASGEATLPSKVSRKSKHLSDIVKQHAPAKWMQLLDLHVRQAEGPDILRWSRFTSERPSTCTSKSCLANGLAGVQGRMAAARDFSEFLEVSDGGFGIHCGQGCSTIAEKFYDPKLRWLSRYTTQFYLDPDDENFVGC